MKIPSTGIVFSASVPRSTTLIPVTLLPSPTISAVRWWRTTAVFGSFFRLSTRTLSAFSSFMNSTTVTEPPNPGEVDRGLDPRVAAADDDDPLVLVEGAVAVRAKGDAAPDVLLLAGDVQLAPLRARRHDERLRLEDLAPREADRLQLSVLDRLHAPVVEDLDRVAPDVGQDVGGQLLPLGVGRPDEVVDADRLEDLPPDVLGDERGAEPLADRVDRRGRAGRASPDDDDVVGLANREVLRRSTPSRSAPRARRGARRVRPGPRRPARSRGS